jgi:hypothetical protein
MVAAPAAKMAEATDVEEAATPQGIEFSFVGVRGSIRRKVLQII